MVNINLAEVEYAKERQSITYNKSVLVLSIIIILLALAYVGIFFSEKNVLAKTEAANSRYSDEHSKLINNNKDIVDFQNRLTAAKGLIKEKDVAYASLPVVEKAIIPGSYLDSFDFEQNTNSVEISGVADNFDVLARQILSFKQSDYFSGVTTGKTSLNKDGKVEYSLSLNIK